ncbi:MAG: hypothetical protein ACOYOA_02720 [Saprospiraceae bacterium]
MKYSIQKWKWTFWVAENVQCNGMSYATHSGSVQKEISFLYTFDPFWVVFLVIDIQWFLYVEDIISW